MVFISMLLITICKKQTNKQISFYFRVESHQAIIESLSNNDAVAAGPLFNRLNWTVDNHQTFQKIGRDGEQLMHCIAPTSVVSLY